MNKKKKTILIAVLAGLIGGGTGPYVARIFGNSRFYVGISAAIIAAIIAFILSLILKNK